MLGPTPTSAPTPTCCGSARCRRRSARSAGSSPARARLRRAASRTAPGRTSSRPRRRPPTPRPRSPRSRVVRSAEGDALVARLRAHVDRLRPGHPSPIVPFVLRRRGARARGGRGAARARPARPRDPAADGRARHVPAAGHAVGRAHRRRRSIALVDALARRVRRDPRAVIVVVVAGTGTEVGKTWVTAACARAARARRHGRGAQAGAVVRARRRPPPTPTCSRAATGDDPTTCARRTAGSRWRWRRRWRPTRSAGPAFTIADLVGEIAAGRRDMRPRRERRRACAPRSPTTATPSTSPTRSDPRSSCSSPTPGLGTINLVRLSRRRARRARVVVYLNRFDAADELHARNRDWLRDARGPRGRHRPRGPRRRLLAASAARLAVLMRSSRRDLRVLPSSVDAARRPA